MSLPYDASADKAFSYDGTVPVCDILDSNIYD